MLFCDGPPLPSVMSEGFAHVVAASLVVRLPHLGAGFQPELPGAPLACFSSPPLPLLLAPHAPHSLLRWCPCSLAFSAATSGIITLSLAAQSSSSALENPHMTTISLFLFLFWPPHGHMELPRQGLGSNPSCNLSCSWGNTRSLTHCAWPGSQHASQRSQDTADPIAP